MVKAPTGPQPPRTEPVALAQLTDVELLVPAKSDVREAERYARIDLSGQDLQFWSFTDCQFEQTGLNETRLRGSRLSEVIMTEIDAPVFSAPRASWRNVEVTGSRLGSAELYASTWRSVTITGSKINYLNARTADWQDVRFTDCALDELDLSDATVTRLGFTGCRIGTLSLAGARLTDVDLRDARLEMINGLAGLGGAWISEAQLAEVAPLLAAHLEIRVSEG